MDLNLSAFQEPRGVMRIFQFIFAICAFASTANFGGTLSFFCDTTLKEERKYSYPFRLHESYTFVNCASTNTTLNVFGNFTSDAQFFVATGVISMLLSLGIAFLYAKFDDTYKNNPQWPLIDFVITVVMAVLWLSGSAAWANGLTGLKSITSLSSTNCAACHIHSSSFSTLNISVILGFLNFFLWSSDLWFLYKETEWFQQKQPTMTTSPTI